MAAQQGGPRLPSYEHMISAAIRADENPMGSSIQAITRHVSDNRFAANNRPIPKSFKKTLHRRLDILVNRGTLTRTGNTFNLRPENEMPADLLDTGFDAGLWRVAFEVGRQVSTVRYSNIRGWRELFRLVENVAANPDVSPDTRAEVQEVANALRERQAELRGGR